MPQQVCSLSSPVTSNPSSSLITEQWALWKGDRDANVLTGQNLPKHREHSKKLKGKCCCCSLTYSLCSGNSVASHQMKRNKCGDTQLKHPPALWGGGELLFQRPSHTQQKPQLPLHNSHNAGKEEKADGQSKGRGSCTLCSGRSRKGSQVH